METWARAQRPGVYQSADLLPEPGRLQAAAGLQPEGFQARLPRWGLLPRVFWPLCACAWQPFQPKRFCFTATSDSLVFPSASGVPGFSRIWAACFSASERSIKPDALWPSLMTTNFSFWFSIFSLERILNVYIRHR